MSRKIPGLTSVMAGTGFLSLGAAKPKPTAKKAAAAEPAAGAAASASADDRAGEEAAVAPVAVLDKPVAVQPLPAAVTIEPPIPEIEPAPNAAVLGIESSSVAAPPVVSAASEVAAAPPVVLDSGGAGEATAPARPAKPRPRVPARPSAGTGRSPARPAPAASLLLLTDEGTDLSAYVDPEDEAPARRGGAVKYHGIKLPNAEGAMLKRLADTYGYAMGTMLATELTPLLTRAADIVAQYGSVRLPNINTAPRHDSWSVNVPRSPEIETALATITAQQPVKVHKILVRIAVPAIRARYAREFPEG